MGCLKKILQIIVLALALIGFISIGGKDFIIAQYEKYMGNSKEAVMERASKVGDFSNISEEYTIDKAASAFGYQGVLAEHDASGQKLIIVNTGKKPIVTSQDFKDGTVDEKLQDFIRKFKYQSLQVDDFTITKQGTMNAYNQEVPYVRFTAKINKLPIGQVGGIISAVDTGSNESKMLISLNENKKYSQLITNEFFKQVK
ncbi:hypothetical protein IJ843_01630 [bacterium]|nr:hypothetical protein [bacterium]